MSRQFRNIRSEIFKTGMSPLNYGDVQVSFEDFQLLGCLLGRNDCDYSLVLCLCK